MPAAAAARDELLDEHEEGEGVLDAVARVEDGNRLTFPVRVALPEPAARLRFMMRADAAE